MNCTRAECTHIVGTITQKILCNEIVSSIIIYITFLYQPSSQEKVV